MRSQITFTWNPENLEETKVSYSVGYDELSRIEKLDFLQDAIGTLTEKYNLTLKKLNGE